MNEYNLSFEEAVKHLNNGLIVELQNGYYNLFYKIVNGLFFVSSNKTENKAEWHMCHARINELYTSKFRIVEPEPVLKEVKFYKVFDVEDGNFSFRFISKNIEQIDNYNLITSYLEDSEKLTTELAYTAYFNENNQVLKYVLPSGEEILA